jgi:hypothetical protein
VTCRNEDPEAHERLCGGEQSDQVLVGLCDGVRAVSEPACVAADASGAFHDVRGAGGALRSAWASCRGSARLRRAGERSPALFVHARAL